MSCTGEQKRNFYNHSGQPWLYYAITFPGGGGGGGTSNKDRCTDRGFEYIGTEVNIPNNGPRNKVCMNKIEIFYHLKIINKISIFWIPGAKQEELSPIMWTDRWM